MIFCNKIFLYKKSLKQPQTIELNLNSSQKISIPHPPPPKKNCFNPPWKFLNPPEYFSTPLKFLNPS